MTHELSDHTINDLTKALYWAFKFRNSRWHNELVSEIERRLKEAENGKASKG